MTKYDPAWWTLLILRIVALIAQIGLLIWAFRTIKKYKL
jgi:hypothetical protein